jgi:hypothetical protein
LDAPKTGFFSQFWGKIGFSENAFFTDALQMRCMMAPG